MNNVTFTDETLKKNKLLIDKQELNDLLLGTKEMHSMNFDTDGVLRRRSKSGWKVIFDFICNKIIHVKVFVCAKAVNPNRIKNDNDSKGQLDIMKKEKEKEMIKKLEKEKEDTEMFAKGKIPYHIKLREATIRDIKLTPEQKNLVSIRNKFDEIRKHESELNGWISKIKKSNSPERCRTTNNSVL